MLELMIFALDLAIVAAMAASSWLWYATGRRPPRRISRHEVLDAADINRIVTAVTRSQILNARAALATAAATLLAAIRVLLDVFF